MDSGFDPTKQQAVKHYFAVESESVDAQIFKKKHFQILRDHVVRLICIYSRTRKFDAYIPYLAVSYFDRFISRNPLPIIGYEDLNYRALNLSLCCLSLAWKIRNHFSFKNFPSQRVHLEFNREMELKVLYGLEWKMYSVNALHFVRYFLSVALIPGLSFRRISEIIIQAQGDIYFTEFKPSVLAASAILTAIHFQNRDKVDFRRDILTKGGLVRLNESEVTRCMNSMIGMWGCMGNTENAPKMPTDGASTVGGDDSEKEKVPEIEEVSKLNFDFELKWIKNYHNENLLMTLDPALFLPETVAVEEEEKDESLTSLMQLKLL